MTGSEYQEMPLLCVRHITCPTTPNWSLVWFIACSLITFLSFSESFTSSDPLRLLKYSRYKPKGVSLCRLYSQGMQEKPRLMWTICRLCVCVCVEVTDRQRRTKWGHPQHGTALQRCPGTTGSIPQRDRNRIPRLEMYSWRYLQVLKLLSSCSHPFLKLW